MPLSQPRCYLLLQGFDGQLQFLGAFTDKLLVWTPLRQGSLVERGARLPFPEP